MGVMCLIPPGHRTRIAKFVDLVKSLRPGNKEKCNSRSYCNKRKYIPQLSLAKKRKVVELPPQASNEASNDLKDIYKHVRCSILKCKHHTLKN